MAEFRLPDLGEGLTEAVITTWHVAVGDTVTVDQVVVEVETAKAAVEVPVPFAGEVSALHGKAGETVAVGAPLISVAQAEGFQEPGVVASPGGRSGAVLIGYGTPDESRRRRHSRRPAATTAGRVEVASDRVAVISPLVRKLARDAALDLATVSGTGPSGLVLRRDVERALHKSVSDVQRIPITGLRKIVADKLSRSRREIPEATVWVDVDATDLLAARVAINSRRPERPVSVLALVARFIVLGLRQYPELNGHVEGDEIVLSSAVHLGFAAQTERGLIVPVVHDAHAMNTRDLSAALSRLTLDARAGSTPVADLQGGTFTVNNYGVLGVDGSAAIINHPEVGILGIGRIMDKPWVVEGQVAVRKLCELTLAFDHRVCDGGTAGGFLRFVADCVESPVAALGDL
ncbi:MAG: 2-oxo acid dehydrogenase subunit E2 [Actinomycetota bacterium]|nr:2-oxo acid dehydrogenase subunit E2 [Actinomycetota bacterium]